MEDKVRELLTKYLKEPILMQLASVTDGQPWICTLHYVVDEDFNFYWLSLPSRRHSQEVVAHQQAAVAVVVKPDMPPIGVQAEGSVREITDSDEARPALDLYRDKLGLSQKFYDDFAAGTNQHHLYKFTPHAIVLFDEVDFPKNEGRHELRLQPVSEQ